MQTKRSKLPDEDVFYLTYHVVASEAEEDLVTSRFQKVTYELKRVVQFEIWDKRI